MTGNRLVQHIIAALQHLHLQLDVLLPDGSFQQLQITGVHLGIENIFRYQQRISDIASKTADIGHGLQQFVPDVLQHVNIFEIGFVFNDVVCLIDGVIQEVVVITQFQILGIGKLQQVRNVHAAGRVIDYGAVPGQPGYVVCIREPVGQRGLAGFFVYRTGILQQEGHDVPIRRNRVLEVIDYEVFIVTGNILVGAGRANGLHGSVHKFAELLIRQLFHRQHKIQIIFIGNVFFRRNVEEDADNTQVLDAGLYLYQILHPADDHFMIA